MLTFKAPAKVNLFLEVLGKRKDGYHELITFFLKIRLFDKIYIKKNKQGIKVTCCGYSVPCDSSNLVFLAAKAVFKAAGIRDKGVHIHVEKRIPVGAGLGGGSSDAAATIKGVNALYKLKLPREKLLDIARNIGADVPLFLFDQPAALGQGRGDIITPFPWKKKLWLILVNPKISVSTKEIYEALPITLTKRKNDVKLLVCAFKNPNKKTLEKTLFNRLETVTFKKFKILSKIKKHISALGVRAVLMSGSGSVIFGIVDNREEAMRIKRKFQGEHEIIVVRNL
ncbi:MAG: 4-(cytidine 5'-diphospho)-2-C-methyl-D-erythritol kinase [Candidatus Omnitrophica bacterium]|nr:4-(cytidine 5'-diphospho)-2-C-methyl-D-erythritol kinase [Candidatus Omnitrophota bacterium]